MYLADTDTPCSGTDSCRLPAQVRLQPSHVSAHRHILLWSDVCLPLTPVPGTSVSHGRPVSLFSCFSALHTDKESPEITKQNTTYPEYTEPNQVPSQIPGHPGPWGRSHSFHLITLVEVMQSVRRHVVENTDILHLADPDELMRRTQRYGTEIRTGVFIPQACLL